MSLIERLRGLGVSASTNVLVGLGGEQALYLNAEEIARSDAVDVAVSALLAEWDVVDQAEASRLILLGLEQTSDPLAFARVLDAALSSPAVVQRLAPDIEPVLIGRAQVRANPGEAHIAIDAWDGLLRLVLSRTLRQFGVLGLLSGIRGDEEPSFATSIARRLGVIYLYFSDPASRVAARDALLVLRAGPEARSDAEHELGAACLVDALESALASEVESAMRRARRYFSSAVESDADRVDAQLYAAALDGVLALVEGGDPAVVTEAARSVGEMALLRKAWQTSGRLSRWLGDPSAAEAEWWMVVECLAEAAPQLSEEIWLNAASSLEAIARAYRATRVARVLPVDTPGLQSLIEPRLSTSFVDSYSRSCALVRWAREIEGDPELVDSAVRLEELIADPPAQGAAIARLRDQLPDPELLDTVLAGLRKDARQLLERRLVTLEGDESVLLNPIARRLGQDIRSELEGSADYEGQTRIFFDRIVDLTIRFVESRLDVEPGFGSGGWSYLARPDALEAELQVDFFNFVKGTMLGGVVDLEIRNTGGGRADIRFSLGATKVVAELKRDKTPVEPGKIDSYLNQTGLYQGANVALGLLLILDISPKPHGEVRSLSQSIWVAAKPALAAGDMPRAIVTAVVSGNRPSPSAVL